MEWYDSIWLRRYFDAKATIAKVAPNRLMDFENAMAVFRTPPSFEVKYVREFLDSTALKNIRETVAAIPRDAMELHELRKFGRLVVHDWPPFNEMQANMVDLVSDLAGERVEPCYNFLSLYSRRGVCEPHLDTPQAKWTFDLCIDQSEPWPISFSSIIPWPDDRDALIDDWRAVREGRSPHEIRAMSLEPGDALLFSGANQWHYRAPIPGDTRKAFCDLLFFHFIPEGTAELVRPRNWASLFDVPELDSIDSIAQTA